MSVAKLDHIRNDVQPMESNRELESGSAGQGDSFLKIMFIHFLMSWVLA